MVVVEAKNVRYGERTFPLHHRTVVYNSVYTRGNPLIGQIDQGFRGFSRPYGKFWVCTRNPRCISCLYCRSPTLNSKFAPKHCRLNVIKISSHRGHPNTFFIPRPSKHKVRHNVRLLSPVAYSNNPFRIGFLYFPKLRLVFILPHYSSPLSITFIFFTFNAVPCRLQPITLLHQIKSCFSSRLFQFRIAGRLNMKHPRSWIKRWRYLWTFIRNIVGRLA